MNDLERIEDMYPDLKFWGIEIDNPHYHGHIDGKDVYINLLQPDLDWLITALHEASHYENDSSNLTDRRDIKTMRAEKWAVKESLTRYNKMFG